MTEPNIPLPTRAAGLARLAAFTPRAGRRYARDRNTDFGPSYRENVSMLSPYIRHRLITEHEVLAAVLTSHKDGETDAFVAEVFWRTYFKGWLEMRPSVWTDCLARVAAGRVALAENAGLRHAYEAAIEGRTGIDAFDAFARDLVDTGYLHNHARMWFASIWIFTLKLPWALGADFTLRHFIDGDPASNTLSWRWVAGLQTRGKTYLARRDNIVAFTDGRFDPGGLAAEAVPLDEPEPPPAAPIRPAERPPAERAGLLLHEDDLSSESLDLGGADIVAITGAAVDKDAAAYRPSQAASLFKAGALTDGVVRGAAALGLQADPAAILTPAEIVDFARRHGLRTVVTPYAPVGLVTEALDRAEAVLREQRIALIRVRRVYDDLAWPHGTRGFFQMRAKIPMLLDRLGIPPG